jgi:PAS domain S-box-containing protein
MQQLPAAASRQITDLEEWFDLSPDMMIVSQRDGRLLRINPAAVQALGAEPAYFNQRTLLELVQPHDKEKVKAALQTLSSHGGAVPCEARFQADQGPVLAIHWQLHLTSRGLVQGIGRRVEPQSYKPTSRQTRKPKNESAQNGRTVQNGRQAAQLHQTISGYSYDQQTVKPYTRETRPRSHLPPALVQDIQLQGRKVGQLVVSDDNVLDEAASDIVSGVLEILSGHLENLTLYEETRSSLAHTDALFNLSQAVIALENLESLLEGIVSAVADNLPADRTALMTCDTNAQAIDRIVAGGPGRDRVATDLGYDDIRAGLSGWVMKERTHAIALKGLSDPRESKLARQRRMQAQEGSTLVVPILFRDRVLGTLTATNRPDQPDFSETDANLMTAMANQAAAALENVRLYQEQVDTIERLQELDNLKTSFLANMSHELRTPMNSILGFTQVILEGIDGPLTDSMESDLKIVEKNGHHLLSLINDVLDMAKIDAGKMELAVESVDLSLLLSEVYDITEGLIGEKNLQLRTEVDRQNPVHFRADPIRLRQVLINLVGNAIKFTESGTVILGGWQEMDCVRIAIRDTGIGLPMNDLEVVFEAFSQIDDSTTRKASGSGLGLPISRRLIELHGGKLWAESSGIRGAGSVFHIKLPISLADQKPAQETSLRSEPGAGITRSSEK